MPTISDIQNNVQKRRDAMPQQLQEMGITPEHTAHLNRVIKDAENPVFKNREERIFAGFIATTFGIVNLYDFMFIMQKELEAVSKAYVEHSKSINGTLKELGAVYYNHFEEKSDGVPVAVIRLEKASNKPVKTPKGTGVNGTAHTTTAYTPPTRSLLNNTTPQQPSAPKHMDPIEIARINVKRRKEKKIPDQMQALLMDHDYVDMDMGFLETPIAEDPYIMEAFDIEELDGNVPALLAKLKKVGVEKTGDFCAIMLQELSTAIALPKNLIEKKILPKMRIWLYREPVQSNGQYSSGLTVDNFEHIRPVLDKRKSDQRKNMVGRPASNQNIPEEEQNNNVLSENTDIVEVGMEETDIENQSPTTEAEEIEGAIVVEGNPQDNNDSVTTTANTQEDAAASLEEQQEDDTSLRSEQTAHQNSTENTELLVVLSHLIETRKKTNIPEQMESLKKTGLLDNVDLDYLDEPFTYDPENSGQFDLLTEDNYKKLNELGILKKGDFRALKLEELQHVLNGDPQQLKDMLASLHVWSHDASDMTIYLMLEERKDVLGTSAGVTASNTDTAGDNNMSNTNTNDGTSSANDAEEQTISEDGKMPGFHSIKITTTDVNNGPYVKKLQESGIYTYGDLENYTYKELAELTGTKSTTAVMIMDFRDRGLKLKGDSPAYAAEQEEKQYIYFHTHFSKDGKKLRKPLSPDEIGKNSEQDVDEREALVYRTVREDVLENNPELTEAFQFTMTELVKTGKITTDSALFVFCDNFDNKCFAAGPVAMKSEAEILQAFDNNQAKVDELKENLATIGLRLGLRREAEAKIQKKEQAEAEKRAKENLEKQRELERQHLEQEQLKILAKFFGGPKP